MNEEIILASRNTIIWIPTEYLKDVIYDLHWFMSFQKIIAIPRQVKYIFVS